MSDRYRCRGCQTSLDGMGITCTGCGNSIRIPIRFADGRKRYLPRGMTLDAFDEWLEQQSAADGVPHA